MLRSPRAQVIVKAAGSAAAARAVGLLANLAQVPIALAYLGTEAFGLWMVIVGALQLMTFADLGMGLGLQNRVAEAYGSEHYGELRDAVYTAYCLFGGIGLVLLGLLLPVCWAVPWPKLIELHSADLQQAMPASAATALGFFAMGLPLTVGVRVAFGIQRGWFVGASTMVSSLLSLLAVWIAAKANLGFSAFLALALLPALVTGLGLCVVAAAVTPKTPERRGSRFRSDLLRPLLAHGALFLVPQVAASIITIFPGLVLAGVRGAAAVATFNVCQRLSSAVLQLQAMPLQPLWPALAEAKARADFEWIARADRAALRGSIAFGLAAGVGLLALGGWAIQLWTRGAIAGVDGWLLLGFALWVFFVALFAPIVITLNAFNVLKGQAWGGVISSLALIVFTPTAASRFGAAGVIGAMLIAWVVGSCPLVLSDYYKLRARLAQHQA